MAKVRKNKRANYWEVDYLDLFRKRKVKGEFKTKVEAEKFMVDILSKVQTGTAPGDCKMTFKEASEIFMRLHASKKCKYNTEHGYKGYLKNHLLPYFGNLKLCEITPLAVNEFVALELETGRRNSTVNKYTKLMSQIYSFMIDMDIVVKNPLARIKSLKEERSEEIRSLSTEETKILLSKTKEIYPDFYPLLFTALFTGMRQGELMGLTWDSINWITRKITVDKNFTHGRVGTTKTEKARKVDMSLELVKVLKEWRLACPKGEHNLVFPNGDGGHQDANNMIKRRFKPALNRAGIDSLRFHDLRHTYASLLLANGAPMKYVQHQLGHSSIKMTMDLYTHLLPEVNEQCVNLLDNIVEKTTTEMNIRKFGT